MQKDKVLLRYKNSCRGREENVVGNSRAVRRRWQGVSWFLYRHVTFIVLKSHYRPSLQRPSKTGFLIAYIYISPAKIGKYRPHHVFLSFCRHSPTFWWSPSLILKIRDFFLLIDTLSFPLAGNLSRFFEIAVLRAVLRTGYASSRYQSRAHDEPSITNAARGIKSTSFWSPTQIIRHKSALRANYEAGA